MLDTDVIHYRKNQINLSDYDLHFDIQIRAHLSAINERDVLFLEALIYNSLKITIEDLCTELDYSSSEITTLLSLHDTVGLYSVHGNIITIDKEVRKKIEWELEKFDPQFLPGLNLIRASLKKVPVYVLPQWYKLSKTTDNIFEAVREKFLITPQVYNAYLLENKLENPTAKQLYEAISNTENYEISLSDFLKEHPLSKEELHEAIILLEFNLMGCLIYKKNGNSYVPYVSFFSEWKTHLIDLKKKQQVFLKNSISSPLTTETPVVNQMTNLLENLKQINKKDQYLPILHTIGFINTEYTELSSRGKEWLELPHKNKCFVLFNTLLYRYLTYEPLYLITNENRIRECCAILINALSQRETELPTIMETLSLPLHKDHKMQITREGKIWAYSLPSFNEKEQNLLQHLLDHLLYYSGIINKNNNKYTATEFGVLFFK